METGRIKDNEIDQTITDSLSFVHCLSRTDSHGLLEMAKMVSWATLITDLGS